MPRDRVLDLTAGGTRAYATWNWFTEGTGMVMGAVTDAHGLAIVERIADGAMVCTVSVEGCLPWLRRFNAPPAHESGRDASAPDLIVTLAPSFTAGP